MSSLHSIRKRIADRAGIKPSHKRVRKLSRPAPPARRTVAVAPSPRPDKPARRPKREPNLATYLRRCKRADRRYVRVIHGATCDVSLWLRAHRLLRRTLRALRRYEARSAR